MRPSSSEDFGAMLSHRAESRREARMQIPGMLYCARLLEHVEFPASEILGPGATEDEIQGLIDRHKLIFIKPLFRGGIGKKGKAAEKAGRQSGKRRAG